MKNLLFFAMTVAGSAAHAEMPLPLMDNDPTNSQFQADVADGFLAALECRKSLDLSSPKIRALLPQNESSQWEIIPPKSFRVFGLPVESIEIYIDPTGEMGSSYSSLIAAPVDLVSNVIKLNIPKKAIGPLMASEGSRPSLTQLTCTEPGTMPTDWSE